MGFFKGVIKTAAVAKVLQVAQRELSKPQNQAKAKEMLAKLKNRAKR